MNKVTNLQKARQYIKENRSKVDSKYRLKYHVMGEVGWINDPNGFCTYQDEYHLFFQYHPYSSEWGPMHWGHVKSKDLIKWEHLPVALAPDSTFDANGCFSGSAIEKDGELYLMYTGHLDPDPGNPKSIRQVQNIARSKDGIEFEKIASNPVIGSNDAPDSTMPQDFRDPKVFKRGQYYYTVIGARHTDKSGQVLLYKSKDLLEWEYVGELARSEHKIGDIWECPDVFPMGEEDVLIVSPQFLENDGDKYSNLHSSLYLVGKLNLETGKYDYHTMDQIDDGFDFYAPQTLEDNRGRRIMIAWMNMWDRNNPTNSQAHNWAGAMTLPRELKMINGKLYQIPVDDIEQYRSNHVSYSNVPVKNKMVLNGVQGQHIELELEIETLEATEFGLSVLKNDKQETRLSYDTRESKFILDRSKSGQEIDQDSVRKAVIPLYEGLLKLRVFIDRSAIEIFMQDGERVMSATVYPDSDAAGIEFFTDKEIVIRHINKWDIEV